MTDGFRVGITHDFQVQAPGLLEPALEEVLQGFDLEWMPDTGAEARGDVLDRYDAILALGLRFPSESLASVRRLAVIARWGVGCDRIDVAACSRAGVLVAITPDAVRRPVAEGIFALIFALAKNLRTLDGLCRSGRWRESLPQSGQTLEGKTLGSIGAGNIASEMFRIARGLGFGRLLACDPYVAAPPPGVEMVTLETVLRQSDFVAVNCPLNPETQSLIGRREIGWMKPTAYLINTARGPIVDEPALIDALRSCTIAGAGLDVFRLEPVPADNPLLEMDNVIVAPHAVAWTREMARDNSLLACRNVLEVAHGRIPRHIVNREALDHPALLEKLARLRNLRPADAQAQGRPS